VSVDLDRRAPYDCLLTWASELGTGSWRQWRETCDELAIEPTIAAQNLAALGHVELDWATDTFSCAPPTAAFLRSSSGCLLLTGARRRNQLATLRALVEDNSDLDVYLHEAQSQRTGPATVLVEAELRDAEAFCAAAGLRFAFDPAQRLAAALPRMSFETVAAHEQWPPDATLPRRRFDPDRVALMPDRGRDREDGLWWYEGYRRQVAWVSRAGEWWRFSTREYAPYLAFPEHTFLRYSARHRQLTVPTRTPLPPLAARAATLASGRLPRQTGEAEANRLVYLNIDAVLAARIAASLSTPLGEAPR